MNFGRFFFSRAVTYQKSAIPLVLTPIGISLILKNRTANFLDMPSTSTIIKGNYENKVRRGSPIEKIFDVFATGKNEEGLCMTFFDLLRAVCPFNYSTKEISEMKKYLEENPPEALKKLIDLDQSGDISVVEYYIFWILHEINIPDLKKQFHSQKDVKREEFMQFLRERGNTAKIGLTETILPDGRGAKVDKEHVDKCFNEFLDKLYEGQQHISLQKLIDMKVSLRNEIYAFEFNTFELVDGKMDASDFAKSLISYVEPRKAGMYLEAADKMESKGSLTFHDYIAFKEFVIDDLEEFEEKIKDYGTINKKKYHQILINLCEDNDHKLTELQRNIIFELLDSDGNGKIEYNEYVGLLKNAKKLGRSIEEGVSSGKVVVRSGHRSQEEGYHMG